MVSCKQELPPNYTTNMSSTTTTVTVKSLMPGKAYKCEGAINYHNYKSVTLSSGNELLSTTKKLDFSITSLNAFQIAIKFENLRNLNLKIFYKCL